MTEMKVMQALDKTGVIAIVRGLEPTYMRPLAEALWQGGVRLMEVTMNTVGVVDSIADLADTFGDKMCIGAGTVLNSQQAEEARHAGASFLVTPHVAKDVIGYGVQNAMPVFSGAMTPTEMYEAYQCGASAVKVFPSRSLGPEYFKDVRGPFADIPLLAVGGVSLANAEAFLRAGAIGWGLGGGLVDVKAMATGDFGAVREQAEAFVHMYKEYRSRSA